jgi:sporulation protein YlmC with PRC-barrel domain
MITKQRQNKKIHIEDILGRKIVTADGNAIGHVADIQLSPAPEFRIIALLYGWGGWYYRLHLLNPFGKKHYHKPDIVPWEAIERIEQSAIRLKPGYKFRDWE